MKIQGVLIDFTKKVQELSGEQVKGFIEFIIEKTPSLYMEFLEKKTIKADPSNLEDMD